MLQEFDLEIKNKKGNDNVIVDHLSRIEKPTEDKRGTEIEENYPYEQLFQVTFQAPWYADLVNYLCNTPKYTLVVFDMFRVFCKHNLIVS